MCRIAGIWSPLPGYDVAGACSRMTETLVHGGPDDSGLFADETSGFAMGHRRLTIIDLTETGRQPMRSADGSCTITYNGEVYNFCELRGELEAKGFTFRGTSDTEVVLNAFCAWGPRCTERFIGMFAFAVWDAAAKRLHLFRDRLGIKPLYYYNDGEIFAFASELKAIHSVLCGRLEVDREALGEFFHYGYIGAPRTIFRHVRKLEPGCRAVVDPSLRIEIHRYWSLEERAQEAPFTDDEETLADRLEELMADAFTKRLIADVDVGVFLSGGIDSSLVTAIIARHAHSTVRTFTIGFAERGYDESAWARAVARRLGTEHTEYTVTPRDAREVLARWSDIYDEPFGDISGIPTSIVSALTRRHVKVSLSADGGDELFCGYRIYKVMDRLARILARTPGRTTRPCGILLGMAARGAASSACRLITPAGANALWDRLRKLGALLANWEGDARASYPYAVAYWLPDEAARLTGGYEDPRNHGVAPSRTILEHMMLWDMVYYLPDDILTKVDRASMSVGLEGREPLLDHRIAEFALRLPLRLKNNNGTMKYILRKILGRHLPPSLFSRPKHGFAVPVYEWLHRDLDHLMDEYLGEDSLKDQNEIDPAQALRALAVFRESGGAAAVDRVWLLLVYMMWRRRYLG